MFERKLMQGGAPSLVSARISVPFPVLAGLSDVVRHPGWVQALTAVKAGLDAGRVVVLVGEPGLGKSLLLMALKRELEEQDQTVVLLPGRDAQGRRPDIVLLDQADRVPRKLLKHLVGGGPRCVLAGPHALLGTLADLVPSPTLVEMRPLSPYEVEPFLLEQVARAGLPASVLRPGTSNALARQAYGNPRRLQSLASGAMFHAWMETADQVSKAHVAAAVAREDGSAGSRTSVFPIADEPFPAPDDPPYHGYGHTMAEASSPALRTAGPGLAAARPSRSRIRPWAVMSGGAVAFCLAALALLAWQRHAPPTLASPVPRNTVTAEAIRPAMPQAADPGPPPASSPEPALPSSVDHPAPSPEVGNGPDGPAQLPLPSTQADPAVAASPPPPAETPSETASEPSASPPPPASVPPESQQAAVPMQPDSPPPLPRPATIPVHVVVAFPPSDAAAGTRGVSLVGALKDAGMDAVLAVGSVSERNAGVRYFFPSDQAAAARVARQIGEAGSERAATIHGVPPRPGTVQIVIVSKPAVAKTSNPTRATEERKVL